MRVFRYSIGRVVLLLSTAFLFLALAIYSLSTGGVTWDEYLDFEGVNGSFWHAINFLKGRAPDFHSISYDLEYYGNSTRWPTYIIWRLLATLNWESISSMTRVQFFLTSGYVGLNHLNSILYGFVGIVVAYLLGRLLFGRNSGYIAAIFLLLLPSWLGHSWMNSKDIPFATSYLIYTYGSTLLISRQGLNRRSSSLSTVARVLGISLMIGSRATSIAFVLFAELIYALLLGRSYLRSAVLGLIIGLLVAFIVTPQAWSNPAYYLIEVFQFAGKHLSTGSPISAAEYIVVNLVQAIPLLLLVGLALFVYFGLRSFGFRRKLIPALVQLLFPISLIILGSKSLYNDLRHVMFVFPIICIFASGGYVQLYSSLARRRIMAMLLTIYIFVSITLLLIENISTAPYQYLYQSDTYRIISSKDVSLKRDYWGFSMRELLSSCYKDEVCSAKISSSPLHLRGADWNKDLFAAFSSLFKSESPSDLGLSDGRVLEVQIGDTDQCSSVIDVRRKLFFPSEREYVISRIAECRNAYR